MRGCLKRDRGRMSIVNRMDIDEHRHCGKDCGKDYSSG